MVVDAAFFASNLAKLLDGGYVPLLLALAVYAVTYERPGFPRLMSQLAGAGCDIETDDLTYFVALEQVSYREDGAGLPSWITAFFATLLRSGTRVTDCLQIPADRLVGLSKQISVRPWDGGPARPLAMRRKAPTSIFAMAGGLEQSALNRRSFGTRSNAA